MAKSLNHHIKPIIIITHINFLLGFTAIYTYLATIYTSRELIFPLCSVLVLFAVWCAISWKSLNGSFFNIYFVFFVTVLAFNSGQAFLEIFGLNPRGVLNGRFTAQTLTSTLVFIIISLMVFHLGALLSNNKSLTVKRQSSEEAEIYRNSLILVGWLFLLISIVPMVTTTLDRVITAQSSGYFSLYQEQAATGIDGWDKVLAKFMIPGVMFLLAGSAQRSKTLAIATVVLLFYVVAETFFVGIRGWSIPPLIAYVWLWHKTKYPLPLKSLFLLSVIVLIYVFPTVKAVRNNPDDFGANFIHTLIYSQKSFGDNLVESIAEMGGTMRTIAHTIELVPKERPFALGNTYLVAFTTVFPNLFWDLHPAVAAGLPGSWLTARVEPIIFANGGGLGYSFLAEAYLNFGFWGAPIALALFGYFLGKVDKLGERVHRPGDAAFVAIFFSFLPMLARGELALITRSFAWYTLFPYCVFYFVSKTRIAKRKSPIVVIDPKTLEITQ